VVIAGGKVTTVTVTNVFGEETVGASGSDAPAGTAAPPATEVAGVNLTRPGEGTAPAAVSLDTLPRTGSDPWRATAVALVLVVGGGLALTAGRRRRSPSGA
jgi:hypothetical protein